MLPCQIEQQLAGFRRIVMAPIGLVNLIPYVAAIIGILVMTNPQIAATNFCLIIGFAYVKVISRNISPLWISLCRPVESQKYLIVA